MKMSFWFFGAGSCLVLMGILQSLVYTWKTGDVGYPPKLMYVGLFVIAADMLVSIILIGVGMEKFP